MTIVEQLTANPIRPAPTGRLLALVLARGGSKRIPHKNIRLLGGKPLINWTLELALQSGLFCDVLVSTDDPAIATVAVAAGALVPWLRPPALATDEASSLDVVLHALAQYQASNGPVDGLMLLQPTTPFRTAKTLNDCAHLFFDQGRRPVVTVRSVDLPVAWCVQLQGQSMVPVQGWVEFEKRSQDLPPTYAIDGSVYLATPQFIEQQRRLVGPQSQAYVVSDIHQSLDIDTWDDWQKAEHYVSKL